MTSEILKDIGEIYTRVFNHRQFLSGEINFFLKEFELQRNDREVENLFGAVQNTIDAKDNTVERCRALSETNLPVLKIKLDETLTLCENVLNRQTDPKLVEQLDKSRVERLKLWERFDDDMKHKRSCVENTFEEKEEELREFYSDLERKLYIHN